MECVDMLLGFFCNLGDLGLVLSLAQGLVFLYYAVLHTYISIVLKLKNLMMRKLRSS